MDSVLLSWIVFAPSIGALAVAVVPAGAVNVMRRLAVAVSLVPLALTFLVWQRFDAGSSAFQFVEHAAWIPSLGISYSLGVDGISLLLLLLTVYLTPLVLLSAADSIHRRLKGYLVSMLLLETAMSGTLVATDAMLFYVFWELMLVPMFLIIGVWGGERRVYAAVKFLLFTLVGSLPMLGAFIYIALQAAGEDGRLSFALADLVGVGLSPEAALVCFLAISLAFAVKVPMWPLHTWLPDAHVEAPTGGSVILAGVLLKMGTYGFVRFVIPMFPLVLSLAMPWIAVLAVVGIVYGALVAMVQPDMKKLVAYSSVSHLGFVMLGLAALNTVGIKGAVYQMLNHGVSTGALFLLVGVIYERRHTRLIAEFGGLWKQLPLYAACFLVVTLSSIGLPGLNGFVGEFLILLGAFRSGPVLAAVATSGVILGAAYLLWMYKRVMFGPLDRPENAQLTDLTGRELSALVPLIAVIVVMGVYPGPFLHTMDASVDRLVADVRAAQAAADAGPRRAAAMSPAVSLLGTAAAAAEGQAECADDRSPWTSVCRGVTTGPAVAPHGPAGAAR